MSDTMKTYIICCTSCSDY